MLGHLLILKHNVKTIQTGHERSSTAVSPRTAVSRCSGLLVQVVASWTLIGPRLCFSLGWTGIATGGREVGKLLGVGNSSITCSGVGGERLIFIVPLARVTIARTVPSEFSVEAIIGDKGPAKAALSIGAHISCGPRNRRSLGQRRGMAESGSNARGEADRWGS